MLSTKSIAPSHLRSPSVTSVRCFPRSGSFPPRSHAVHQKRCTVAPQIPLCDLRDLCAMLSPKPVFPAQKPCCPPKTVEPPSPPFSNSKHPKSRPMFVHVVRCSIVISLAEILRGGDVNGDFRRRPAKEIGSDFFFVFFCEIILQPLSVNQRDNRLYVGIELYNAVSCHSPLTCSLRLQGRKLKTPPASIVLADAMLRSEGPYNRHCRPQY